MEVNIEFDPLNVRPFGMDGLMVQAQNFVDLIKDLWVLFLILHGYVL